MRVDMKFSAEADPQLLMLQVDTQIWHMDHNLMGSYVQGKPLSQWLSPFSMGMKKWKGFFEESFECFNTTSYDLFVQADEEVAKTLTAAAAVSGGDIRVHWVKPAALGLSASRAIRELEPLARTRFLKKNLRSIESMIARRPMRVLVDPGSHWGTVRMCRPDWLFEQGEYTLPLALVSSVRELQTAIEAAQLNDIAPERLLVCVIHADDGKCIGICNEAHRLLSRSMILPFGEGPSAQEEDEARWFGDVVEANARFYLKGMYREAGAQEWSDAGKAKQLIGALQDGTERSEAHGKTGCA